MSERSQLPSDTAEVLAAALLQVARAPVLLVATDFDGTIAPIVADPASAAADAPAILALKRLAALPQTHVALISGRALSDLTARTREVGAVHRVGSHGGEFGGALVTPLTPEAQALFERVLEALSAIAQLGPGLMLETKPAAAALHYRNAEDRIARQASYAVLQGPASWPGVHTRCGKKVIELGVIETDKGIALGRLRRHVGATAVLFIGDDTTDEDAFAALETTDAGVKVGPGESRARFRVADIAGVARTLERVAEHRSAWLGSARATPIEALSLLSDQRTAALVDRNGRVTWMCVPRVDSAAIFAELLGGPAAGFFSIAPASDEPPRRQAYVGDTFVLETVWSTLRLTDYLDCGGGRAFQRAGRTDLVRVLQGAGRARVVFSPRLDFGRMETRLSAATDGLVVEGAVDSVVLRAPGVPWRIVEDGRHQTAIGEFDLSCEPVVFELRFGTGNLAPDPRSERSRRGGTERFWSGWAASLTLPRIAPHAVLRSALLLKALTYGPSGAIVAAATTSLPEHAGGMRNWDYRYCWPRDAAMAASALLRIGATGPGIKLLDWVLSLLDQGEPGGLLRPLYSVTGGDIGSESEVGELAGYRGSRPVRVGNAASHQVQLDVFGPIAELLAQLASAGAALSTEHWRLVEAMVSAVQRRWREPDHGIWEVRRARRNHVHSKVMCWQTVDRCLSVARYLARSRPDWIALRDEIAADVLRRGWSAQEQAFCAAYEHPEPDAAALCVGLSGLLAADDPRFVSTVEYVERHLRCAGTVFRYRYDDGLPGIEGGFNLCTSWLIESLALIGRRAEAEQLFGVYLSQLGPTGLLAEEYDPRENCALGNFPQAYSHLGLINAALRLDAAGT